MSWISIHNAVSVAGVSLRVARNVVEIVRRPSGTSDGDGEVPDIPVASDEDGLSVSRAVRRIRDSARKSAEGAASAATAEVSKRISGDISRVVVKHPAVDTAITVSAVLLVSPPGRVATTVAHLFAISPLGHAVKGVGSFIASTQVAQGFEAAAKEAVGTALVNETTMAAVTRMVDAALDSTVDVAIPALVETSVSTSIDLVKSGILHGTATVGGAASAVGAGKIADTGHGALTAALNFATDNPLSESAQTLLVKSIGVAARGAATGVVSPAVHLAAEQARGEIIRTIAGEVTVGIPLVIARRVVLTVDSIVDARDLQSSDEVDALLRKAVEDAIGEVIRSVVEPTTTLAVRNVVTGTVAKIALNVALEASTHVLVTTTGSLTGAPGKLKGWWRGRRRDED
ncbi:hypothetical protein IEU95_07090 [Hoyosella rhizosphaerae]|uniref:Uncharacterized protein n=1 Tax=Hoyosella rhizosphaerae TaxID=1755582 RepID=A0A916XAS1_9ACTN|nr:hypothetical protein [Hoyosella rhizosphaerae]MBN4926587.1 hypothetical protein [Hoyosella rhizosphaerae]GGC58094.1 hypothetical protein GCM10011410_08210 [Hoyosella rhizosphaerae]